MSAWAVVDGVDYCDGCGNWNPVRQGVLKVVGKLADLYPDGRPGYYCQKCTEKGEYGTILTRTHLIW